MVFTLLAGRRRPLHHLCRKIHFRHAGIGRENLNRPAISVPRLEIHPGIIAGRVFAEDLFNLTGLVEEILPRNGGYQREIGYGSRHPFGIVKRTGGPGLNRRGEGLLDLVMQNGAER